MTLSPLTSTPDQLHILNQSLTNETDQHLFAMKRRHEIVHYYYAALYLGSWHFILVVGKTLVV